MREFFNRIVDWFRRGRLEQELAEELRFHRENAERDFRASGLGDEEAAFAAKRTFGNATSSAEQSRDRWSLPRVEQVMQDVRYALRGLRCSPGFTATAVITLALGIGANVAMFGVVDQMMFKPFPYLRDPSTAHRLYLRATFRGQENWGYGGEYTRYLDMRRHTTSFSQFAAFATQTVAVGAGEDARETTTADVSGSFWEFFDAKPAAGRFFTPSEDVPPRGAEVSVLSYEYWQKQYGGRADVIGQRLQVGAIGTTIIGVTPQGFTGIFDPAPSVYIPITLYAGSTSSKDDRETYFTQYHWGWLETMLRTKPGVSDAQATADITQAFRRSWAIQAEQEGTVLDLDRDRPNGVAGPIKGAAGPSAPLASKTALWVTGVALIVLLIACANVANLSLARAYRRQREIAVRLALGVSRSRLIWQMLIESVLLAVIGGIAGVIIAQWGTVAIQRMLITAQDAARPVVTDWRMLGLVVALVVAAGLLAGLAPAILSGRGDLAPTLRGGARGGVAHRSRLRAVLLIMQGALSVVLLIGATLFVRSLQNVKNFRLGFEPENVFVVTGNLRGYALDSASRLSLQRALLVKAQATPGVSSAAIVNSIPLWSTSSTGLYVAGIDSVEKLGRFTYQVASTDVFKAMGTRILKGRPFNADDRDGSALVMVISEGMAHALWPGKDALGQCVHVRRQNAPCTTVVGIAEDLVQQADQLTDTKRFSYYLPLEQNPGFGRSVRVVVKARSASPTQAEALRRSLQTAMPGPSYVTLRPLSDGVGSMERSWKLGANLFTLFGVLALVVAAVGLYGVIAYNVSQRMHELGVRVALGAQAKDILSLIVGQGARFGLAGVIVGSVLALIAARWVQPLLFQQSARDPIVFIVVGATMLIVAIIACASPARRAAGADPNSALRSE